MTTPDALDEFDWKAEYEKMSSFARQQRARVAELRKTLELIERATAKDGRYSAFSPDEVHELAATRLREDVETP